MDVFVREKWDEMGTFINNVSDPAISPHPKGFHGYIDLGKEFAKLHTFFVEILKTLNKVSKEFTFKKNSDYFTKQNSTLTK